MNFLSSPIMCPTRELTVSSVEGNYLLLCTSFMFLVWVFDFFFCLCLLFLVVLCGFLFCFGWLVLFSVVLFCFVCHILLHTAFLCLVWLLYSSCSTTVMHKMLSSWTTPGSFWEKILMIPCAESDGAIESPKAKVDKWTHHKTRLVWILVRGSTWERWS